MPFVSEALAVTVRVEPVLKLLPLAGLVIDTTGVEDEVTVIVTGLEVDEMPLVSVALAVMLKVPAVRLLHV